MKGYILVLVISCFSCSLRHRSRPDFALIDVAENLPPPEPAKPAQNVCDPHAEDNRRLLFAVALCTKAHVEDILWYGGQVWPEGSDERQRFVKSRIALTFQLRVTRALSLSKTQTKPFWPIVIGSGVRIDRSGRTLTANHVVESATTILAYPRSVNANGDIVVSKRAIRMRVVSHSVKKDVAMLEPVEPMEFADWAIVGLHDAPTRCRPVWQFGNTTGWSRGLIISTDSTSDPVTPVVRSGAKAGPGDSGAPVMNDEGALVGILVAANIETPFASYYVPILDALIALYLPAP